jgi:hypothetical protein
MNYYYLNREEILKRRHIYYLENKEMINMRSKVYFKNYYQQNKKVILENITKRRTSEPNKIKRKKKNKSDDEMKEKTDTHYIFTENDFIIDLSD